MLPAIPGNCQWAIFLRNHDELTLEMVTDEDRDYMYREYAQDPRMRLNVGIRRRLAPLMENGRRQMELLHSLLFSLPPAALGDNGARELAELLATARGHGIPDGWLALAVDSASQRPNREEARIAMRRWLTRPPATADTPARPEDALAPHEHA